jgi:hypothetical protein
MQSTDLPADRCPLCGAVIDAASCLQDDAHPTPGDLTICLRCQGLLIFTEDMHHRVLTNREYLALPADQRALLARAQAEAKRVMQAKPVEG